VPNHRTTGEKHGECIETRNRVNATSADSRIGEAEPTDGFRLSGLFYTARAVDRRAGVQGVIVTVRKRCAASSAVRSRCASASISNPTMNFFTLAERSSGG